MKKYVPEKNLVDGANLSLSQYYNLVNVLDESEIEELKAYFKEADERSFYRENPAEWIADYLGVKIESLVWSMNPGYKESNRVLEDGTINSGAWDGTPNPIYEIMDAIAKSGDVSVESCTGPGKTFLAACLVFWFLACFPGCKVITIAPKKDLLVINLWGEIRNLWPRFKRHYPDAELQHLKIKMDPNKQDDITNDGEDTVGTWMAWGFVAGTNVGEDSSTKARGIHAEHMLFILDEMNGIQPAVLEAIENTCNAPHNLRLALGNPNSKDDSLHQFALRSTVRHIIISSYDHPNVVGNPEPVVRQDLKKHVQYIPGACSWKSILDKREWYGPDPEYYNNHPLYKSMIRGICPTGSAYSIFTAKVLDTVEQFLAIKGERHIPRLSYDILPENDEHYEGVRRIYEVASNTHINRYLIFADVAGDAGDGDWHAAVVLDRVKMKIVALLHMRGYRKRYIRELIKLGELFKVYHWEKQEWHWPLLCWERNAEGALHLDHDFTQYPNLYIERKYDGPKGTRPRNAWGWYTSRSNRSDMTGELENWGLTLRTKPWRVTDERIWEEMRTFEWNEKKKRYEARSGFHDDIMMALGGALLLHKILMKTVSLIKIPGEPEGPMKKSIIERKKLEQKIVREINGRMRQVDTSAFGRAKIKSSFS